MTPREWYAEEHEARVQMLARRVAEGEPLFRGEDPPPSEAERKHHALDPEVAARIVALRRERGADGFYRWRYRDIAAEVRVSLSAVSTVCRAAGLGDDARQQRHAAKQARAVSMRARGASLKEIGRAVGLCESNVGKMCRAAGHLRPRG